MLNPGIAEGKKGQVAACRDRSTARPRASSSPADFAPGLEAAFPCEFQETDCVIESVEGRVPDFVRGTYYLNGPARFGVNDLSYSHWLDGDGMVSALRINKDSIRLRSRYVNSNKLEAEKKAQGPLFRTFGTTFEGSRLNRVNNGLESPVNVSVYPFQGHLLAFGEQGLPWELDPETLETRSQFTFNGRLNDASPFAAHPKFDPESGEMFNFGVFFSTRSPRLYLYCFDHNGLRYRKSCALEYACSVHDFVISKRYVIVYVSPYLLSIEGLLKEAQTVMHALSWEPARGSRLLIFDRQTGATLPSIPIGGRYCLHLINAFDQHKNLFVDVLEFDEPIYAHYQPLPSLFRNVQQGGPVRLTIDMGTGKLVVRHQIPYFSAPDFPSVEPSRAMNRYDEFWMLGISAAGNSGRKFFDQLVHANWREGAVNEIFQAPPMHYLSGEPTFIADPQNESSGAIICQCFNAASRKSSFLIFNARHISDGPVAVLNAGRPLYLAFHAVFVPIS